MFVLFCVDGPGALGVVFGRLVLSWFAEAIYFVFLVAEVVSNRAIHLRATSIDGAKKR